MAKRDKETKPKTPRILNRKARHDYQISEVVEAGIELLGTEVKSLRSGQARIDEAYARVRDGEAYLIGAEIAIYPNAAGELQHAPKRERRLLLHRRQIAQLVAHATQKGKTLVPLALYFTKGWAKIEIGLAVGKREYDKRQAIKDRDQKREMDLAMNRRRRGD